MSSAPESLWQRNKDRLLTGTFLLLLAYSVLRNILRATIRPFWFDELCTWIMAHQPNLAVLWNASTRAADSQPPPFYLLEKFVSHFVSNDQIAFRLPSIFGFCCMQWCLFVWLRRRHSVPIAFTACLIPFLTPIYTVYATEARGYSLSLAGLCLALVAYQRAPERRWILVLALSLAAAESSHLYSFIMMTPFFAAEAVFFFKTKSFRLPVWTALSCGIFPLLVYWPILARFKSYYSYHPWLMHPTILGTLHIYTWLLGIPAATPESQFWPQATWLLVTVCCLVTAILLIRASLRSDPRQDPDFHDGVLIAFFLLLPITLFAVVKITHGVLIARYLLAVVIGFVLAAAWGLRNLSRKTIPIIGVLLCTVIAVQDAGFWFSYSAAAQMGFVQSKPVEQLVSKAGHSELIVVIADGHDYLESEHYASPQWKQRFTFLADYSGALAFGRSDFNDKELLVFRDFAPLRVIEYTKFKALPSPFLLYSNPNSDNDPDWLVLRLLGDGWSLQKLVTDGHSSVYLVTPLSDLRR